MREDKLADLINHYFSIKNQIPELEKATHNLEMDLSGAKYHRDSLLDHIEEEIQKLNKKRKKKKDVKG